MQQTLVGESPLFHEVLDKVSQLAPVERPVLIIGERGTGKELIAQRLHYLSKRWQSPLLTLNCATLSEGLIDSELFGHEPGAFTGAKGRHLGRFERAEGGSLFLDELATTPTIVQEKLLRVIEYGAYERVGGHTPLTCDVRLICATHADLPQLTRQGRFRADLLDRLAFDVINLPPLRTRQQDIPLLAEHFAIKMCRELGRSYFSGFSHNVMAELLHYPWPGNIRELKNVVERAVYQHTDFDTPVNQVVFDPFKTSWLAPSSAHCSEPTVRSQSITSTVNNMEPPLTVFEDDKPPMPTLPLSDQASDDLPVLPVDYKQWQRNADIRIVNQALKMAKFNQRHAADLLGLSYHQFRGMLRKYQIKTD
ncbi:phage shock protein operon transcriptional activator [Vibrio nitrifigilis]|uniref:Phage shock protein operon transcriptional activator n=1 Tax=Vibrio nitrifigilis TaxID=2789781 RepID=A0ABS0GEA9_9VIBR|nr:phage shock protein operon transcriptional activator [Vibrio nitrifigilis]MBF9000739.1 phage shock protein operon transcriptional activator [Vibrio nitrifigilis]